MEQYFDEKYLIKILEKNIGKKIIIFGGGSAASIIINKINSKYNISYIIDNNDKLWERRLEEIIIRSPNTIKEEKIDTFIVLLAGRYSVGMAKQLQEYGLTENKDFYDVYLPFEFYFRLQKADGVKKRFLDFLYRIPENSFKEYKDGKKIAVVAKARIVGQATYYDIALFLLLRYLGHDVTLIFDAQSNGDDFCIGNGATFEAKKIAKEIENVLIQRFPVLKMDWIEDNSKKIRLNDEEISEAKYLTKLNTVWQRSIQNMNTMKTSDNEIQSIFENIFINNMEHIKSYLLENKYEVVVLASGIQYQSGIYTFYGRKQGFRTPSYDGAGFGNNERILWSTNEPCCHHFDIVKLIKKNYFSDKERHFLIKKSEELFQERNKKFGIPEETLYQFVGRKKKNSYNYDVVIPLNVTWDASALGLERLFSSVKEWLNKTVDFIYEHTDAKIAIREHPAEYGYNEYFSKELTNTITEKYGNNSRILIVHSNDKINSYDLIEKAAVVLPLSSTIGTEAAIMNKFVITHSNCYYNFLSYTLSADSQEEYFDSIRKALIERKRKLEREKYEEACLAYLLLLNNVVDTEFNEAHDLKWLDWKIEEFGDKPGVKAIIDAIADNIPICFRTIKERYFNVV